MNNLVKQVSTDSGVRQNRAVECRQSLTISAINYSGRASELGGYCLMFPWSVWIILVILVRLCVLRVDCIVFWSYISTVA